MSGYGVTFPVASPLPGRRKLTGRRDIRCALRMRASCISRKVVKFHQVFCHENLGGKVHFDLLDPRRVIIAAIGTCAQMREHECLSTFGPLRHDAPGPPFHFYGGRMHRDIPGEGK